MREKPAETKEVLRRRLIATRRGTSFEARLEWSRLICRQVCESETFERAELVVAYLPQGAEVDPGDVAAAALETGRELYYPAPAGAVAVRRSDTVAAAGATSRAGGDDVLTRNTPQVLVLVPGVAFDASGRRLGRGAVGTIGCSSDSTVPGAGGWRSRCNWSPTCRSIPGTSRWTSWSPSVVASKSNDRPDSQKGQHDGAGDHCRARGCSARSCPHAIDRAA